MIVRRYKLGAASSDLCRKSRSPHAAMKQEANVSCGNLSADISVRGCIFRNHEHSTATVEKSSGKCLGIQTPGGFRSSFLARISQVSSHTLHSKTMASALGNPLCLMIFECLSRFIFQPILNVSILYSFNNNNDNDNDINNNNI